MPDAKTIREWIEGHTALPSGMDAYTGFQTVMPAKRAVVVGGGFIGLEMAENLVHSGAPGDAALQRGDQVLAPMDLEMARYVERHLEKNGVRLVLNADVSGFQQDGHGALATLGTAPARSIRPTSWCWGSACARKPGWRKQPGWESVSRAGYRVDDRMRTGAPDIFAVGDAVEVKDYYHRPVVARRAGRAGEPAGQGASRPT